MKTDLAQVERQIEKYWAPIFRESLKESTLLAGLINKDYQGLIGKPGDTVRVSQLVIPEAQILDVGVNADSFETTQMKLLDVDVKVDKRIVAAFEVADLVDILSQVKENNSQVRQGLMAAVEQKLNNYLYSKIAPASPSHVKSGVTDFNKAVMVDLRRIAGESKWPMQNPWNILLSPSYYSDLMNAVDLTSGDFVNEQPVVNGSIGTKRFNFGIIEDNSRPTDFGLAFHPDFMHLVVGQPQFKLSDLHANKQFGYVLSVDFLAGCVIGIGGDKLHIKIYNT